MLPSEASSRLAALQEGVVETRHLAEMLQIDMGDLLQKIGLDADDVAALRLHDHGFVERMRRSAQLIGSRFSRAGIQNLQSHESDTVRGWAAYATIDVLTKGASPNTAVLCRAIRPFAADRHFGVREWAWMAVRPYFAADLPQTIALLADWVRAPDPLIRRFAIEVLRPRGVWTRHIPALRQDPSPMRPLLEPLKTEPHKYVQDSIANWLNDAGKDHPDYVRETCRTWLSSHPDHPATLRICRRAQRRLTPIA